MSNVEHLSSRDNLSETNAFILKQQVRAILRMLGSVYVDRVMVRHALDIFESQEDNKVEKLIELVNGRRR